MSPTAILVEGTGGPEVLRLVPRDRVAAGPGEVRVRVLAAGVNYIDVYHRTGFYAKPVPFVPGLEGAGVVDDVGPNADGFDVGTRVVWSSIPGSYATHVVAPVAQLVRIPDDVSDHDAAAVMLQGMTAHYLVHGVRETHPGDVAVVLAAAGGVGLLLVQLLHRAGARVLATCSTAAKAALARAAGADDVVLYRTNDFSAVALAMTDGRGADVVYDGVGRETFDRSMASLRRRGLLVLYGQSSGPVPPLELRRLAEGGSLFVTRPALHHYIASREELELRAGVVLGAVARRELTVRIDRTLPLGDAAAAHRALEARATSGKILLQP